VSLSGKENKDPYYPGYTTRGFTLVMEDNYREESG